MLAGENCAAGGGWISANPPGRINNPGNSFPGSKNQKSRFTYTSTELGSDSLDSDFVGLPHTSARLRSDRLGLFRARVDIRSTGPARTRSDSGSISPAGVRTDSDSDRQDRPARKSSYSDSGSDRLGLWLLASRPNCIRTRTPVRLGQSAVRLGLADRSYQLPFHNSVFTFTDLTNHKSSSQVS